MTSLSILGVSGSIGRTALAVLEAFPGAFRVVALAAGRDARAVVRAARRWGPEVVALADPEAAEEARRLLASAPDPGCGTPGRLGIPGGPSGRRTPVVLAGPEGVAEAAAAGADLVLNAIVGVAGLAPTLAAIAAGSDVALANKESLVAGGPVVTAAARARGVRLWPVDSEPSAIYQCLYGQDRATVRRVILTASGGPFWSRRHEDLAGVTPADAVRHPRWAMGRKISVDSATLMNKGLEVIETRWLFDLAPEQIDVVIHPEAIVHSLVEFADGAVLAQLAEPDMRVAVQLALFRGARLPTGVRPLDLPALGRLSFEAPDREAFPCLRLAEEAGKMAGTAPAALNAANEVAVAAFLDGRIRFTDIPRCIRAALDGHRPDPAPTLDAILAADAQARADALRAVADLAAGRSR